MGLPTLIYHCISGMGSLEVVTRISWSHCHTKTWVKSHGYHTNSIDYHCLGNLIKIAGWNTNSCLRFLGNTTRFGMTERAELSGARDESRCAAQHCFAHAQLWPGTVSWRQGPSFYDMTGCDTEMVAALLCLALGRKQKIRNKIFKIYCNI